MSMINKAHILAELKKCWQSTNSSSTISSWSMETQKINLLNLCSHVRQKNIIYRRSATGEEHLGLGELYRHQGQSSREESLQLLKRNPALKLFFAARFDKDGIKSPEWAHFGEEIGIIPIIQWHTQGEKSWLQINYKSNELKDNSGQANFLFQIEELLDFMSESEQSVRFKSVQELPGEERWCQNIDEIAYNLKHHIFSDEMDKVVMARKRVLRSPNLVNPQVLLSDLQGSYSIGHLFFFKIDHHRAFLSVSPERLFLSTLDHVLVDVIAGTRPRSSDPDEDQALAEDLMNSHKELEEHRIVARDIERRLNHFATSVKATSTEEILKLNHVQHIKGSYEAKITPGLSPFRIMEELHPTPAVGGRPWPEALKVINQYERFDRGLYAGPCGVIGESYSDLMVGIRSMVVYQDEVHIYGGAGIVAESKGKSEWIETHNKMKNFNLHIS